MSVVLAHDIVLSRASDGHIYTYADYAHTSLASYLEVFGEVVLLTRSKEEARDVAQHAARTDGPGVECHFLPNASSVRSLLTGHAEVRKHIREHLAKAETVIARVPSFIGYIAAEEARRAGLPYAVEVVGSAWNGLWHHGDLRAKLLAPYFHARIRQTVRNATAALYVTETYLQRHYPTRGVAAGISNVLLAPPAPNVVAQRLARARSDLKRVRIGLVGSLGPKYKGIDVLLHALRLLAQDPRRVYEVHLLGEGSPDRWRALASRLGVEGSVQFHAPVSGGAAVAAWLDELDLYVQPSRTEGLPRALVEAMSRGLPCIGTKVGGIPELLPPDALVEPGNAPALARYLMRLAAHPEAREAAAQHSLAVARGFAPEFLAAKRRAFWLNFRSLLGHVPGAAASTPALHRVARP